MRYYIIEAQELTPEFEIVSGGFREDQESLAFARFEDRQQHGPARATRALVLAHDKGDAHMIFSRALATGTSYAPIVAMYGTL